MPILNFLKCEIALVFKVNSKLEKNLTVCKFSTIEEQIRLNCIISYASSVTHYTDSYEISQT